MRDRRGEIRVWAALAALLVLGGLYLMYLTRGTTPWSDEWAWVTQRRGWNVDTFLDPHNGHLSLVPVTVYKLLLATVGLEHSAPYRFVVICCHLLCVVLLFAYASRRVGAVAAFVIAALLMLLGPGWQNILWPFQIGFLSSLAAGVGMLLALDRGDRKGDVAACVLLAVSLASSGVGLVVALGALLEVGWGRRRARDAWIVAAPLALYAAWWIAYRDDQALAGSVFSIPGFAADAAAASVSTVAGLAGGGPQAVPATLGWGRPLALVAAAALVWWLARPRMLTPRTLTLLAMPLAFWALAALTRAGISTPAESRYLYVGALLVMLLGVEVLRGVRIPRRGAWLLAAAATLALLGNIGDMRAGAGFLREQGLITRVDLGAVQLARATAPPTAPIVGLPGYPLVVVTVGGYLQAARAVGSPAATPAEIAGAPEGARLLADAELVRDGQVRLAPAGAAAAGAAAPRVDGFAGGALTRHGGCVEFTANGATTGAAVPELRLTVPATGLRLATRGGPATIAARRFAADFPAKRLGALGGSAAAALHVAADGAEQPWHVRVRPAARVSACGL